MAGDSLQLEVTLNRVLLVARLVERALFDHDAAWTIHFGPYSALAKVSIRDTSISFSGTFDEFCWLSEPPRTFVLAVNGEPVYTMPCRKALSDARLNVVWTCRYDDSLVKV